MKGLCVLLALLAYVAAGYSGALVIEHGFEVVAVVITMFLPKLPVLVTIGLSWVITIALAGVVGLIVLFLCLAEVANIYNLGEKA